MSHFVTAKFYMYVDKRTELRNISLHFRRRVSSDIYIVCESRRKCYEESIEFLFSFIISSIRENGSRRKYFFVLFLFIFSNFFFFFLRAWLKMSDVCKIAAYRNPTPSCWILWTTCVHSLLIHISFRLD